VTIAATHSKPLLAVALVASAGMLSACGGFDQEAARAEAEASASAAAAAEVTRLAAVYDRCTINDTGSTMSLEDDDSTIVIDTGSEYGDPTGYLCVIEELDVPSSITAQMDRTTAMMGVQEAEDDGIEFSWSYHPDNGVNMVITDTEASAN
jgi:hypothetical protein